MKLKDRKCYLLHRLRKPRYTVCNSISIIQRHFTLEDHGVEERANRYPIGILRSIVHHIQHPQFYVLQNKIIYINIMFVIHIMKLYKRLNIPRQLATLFDFRLCTTKLPKKSHLPHCLPKENYSKGPSPYATPSLYL